MLRRQALVATCLLLVPLAGANEPDTDHAIHGMVLDRFLDLDLATLSLDTLCGSQDDSPHSVFRFDAAQDRLLFSEGPVDSGPTGNVSGLTRATCGRATAQVVPPAPLDHLHVRFWADRTIDQVANLIPHAVQQFTVTPDVGNATTVHYFPWDAGTRPEQRFAGLGPTNTSLFPMAPTARSISLEWRFEDLGQSAFPSVPSPLSGQDYHGSIRDPWIEFSGVPEPVHDVREDHERDGSRRFDRIIAVVDYNDTLMGPYRTNVRVLADLSVTFSHILAPDGTRITATGILPQDAEYSHDVPYVLLERNSQAGQVAITLPSSLAQQHGPGEYQFVFVQTTALKAEPGLQVLNGAIALVPFLFAAIAFQRVEQFRREAFGAYRRSARNLLITLTLVVAYYTAVLVGAITAGWFSLLSVLPLGTEALLLYLQVAIAIAAFVWLWRTAHELYQITRP